MLNELLTSSHREKELEPGYFEWWYFHFIGEDGTAINLVLHETDIFGLKKEPYMSVSFLKPGEKPVHLSHQRENIMVKGDAERLNFSLPFGQDIRFEGKMIKLAKPLIIENGILNKDSKGRLSNWVVEIPHASFEGTLIQGDSKKEIKGFGYQDHQWGTLPLQEFVSDWIWGHFSDTERSIVFFKILTQQGTQIDRFGQVIKGSLQSDTSFDANYLKDLASAVRPEKATLVGNVTFPESKGRLLFQMKPSNLMRQRVGEKFRAFEASYLRWSSEGLNFSELGKRYLSGVTEYLRIRK